MHVLVIKTGSTISSLQQQGEDFEDWFRQGLNPGADEFSVCSVHQGETLPELADISGIIITGSPAYVKDEARWNFVTADYCRLAHVSKIPLLGVCYGHQLLAWAFGGTVGFHPRGREIGTVTIDLTEEAADDRLFSAMPASFAAQASHLQAVLRLPADGVLLGGNAFDRHHAFRLGETTWGVQFHPEFSAEITRAYIEERKPEISAEGLDATALLRSIQSTPESARLLSRFAEIVRAAA